MQCRIAVFKSYSTHPWLYKSYSKLTASELSLAHEFMEEHRGADKGTFELLINRMFLDKVKPKHYREILELLTCANSRLQ